MPPTDRQPLDSEQFAASCVEALREKLPEAEISSDIAEDMAVLTFVHPAHEATVLLVAEAGDDEVPSTLLVAVVIDDWADTTELAPRYLAMNPRLMSCAIGLLPLNADELVVALTRRLPLTPQTPSEVLPIIEGMIWEFATLSQKMAQAEPQPTQPEEQRSAVDLPPRPRLIGSLDEL